MGEITRQPARAIQNALIDSVLAGLCALIVFGPIVGVVLKGYGFTLAPARVAILVAVVMAGRLALSLLLQSHRGKAFIARFEGADDGVYVRPPGYRSRLRWIIPLLLGLAIVFPFLATKYLLTVAILGLIYVLLGLGLNIVVGLAGLLDLGYVAFYAIGAYGLALGYQYLGLGFWAMLPLGAVMAALAGALLGFPVLRMHGDYLAIVTLGFGEIIRLVLNNWVSFTGGPNGVPVPSPTLFGLEFTRRAKDGGIPIHEFFHVSYNPNLKFIFLYAVLCLVVMLVLLVKHRLTRMPIGRAWEALREDEIACRAMGLNHVLVKHTADLKIHVIEHISRIADKNFPAVGQLQRVGATIEDAESEGSLQRLDASAERRLRDVAGFGRQGKAARLLEGNHIIQPFYFQICQHRSSPQKRNKGYAILA